MANIIQINGKKLKDTSAARMSSLAPVESSATASAAHAVGDYFWLGGILYEATAAIAIGNTITVGANCEVAYLGAEVSELKTQMDDLRDYVYDISPVSKNGPASILSISDAAPLKVSQLDVSMKPIQDGNGTPSSSNIRPFIKYTGGRFYDFGGYKPMRLIDNSPVQLDGAMFKCLEDDYYFVDGELNAFASLSKQFESITLKKSQKYCVVFQIMSFDNLVMIAFSLPDAGASYMLRPENFNGNFLYKEITLDSDTDISSFTFMAMAGLSDLKIKIQLFEVDDEPLKRIDISEDFYGGCWDVINGLLVSEYAYIDSYAGEALPDEWLSSMDVCAPGVTPTTGAQVVYKAETPTLYQETPINLSLQQGVNIVFSPGNNGIITYHQDPGILLKNLMQPDESDMIATTSYAIGDFFMANGVLYRATAAITAGNKIAPYINCIATTVAEQLTNIYSQLS